ncbi:hypothetical protein OKA05_07080 [Luteolibacter arcticus]|uniref:HEAT repeat domain-containing protein n=1 Tax=Luteolibacter arcticus TaxID=1581411 RepID=A0ABT3GFS3_9BACT|nr:hypothetical protein [Luteolibacter arcticus]MCW1922311.1 hypothetical protein [Luteolibacter arcticus]
MKLSRTTVIALALMLAAVLLAAVVFNRPAPEADGVSNDGQTGGSKTGPSTSAAPALPPTKSARTTIVDLKPLAARELELLWARGRGPELLIELDRLSASKDPEHWREVGPLLVKQAAKEGRPEIATYLLATGDAAPDQIRIQIYAAAMDNRDESLQDAARLELENITGEEFANGDAARAWLEANPQPAEDDEEMTEDQ